MFTCEGSRSYWSHRVNGGVQPIQTTPTNGGCGVNITNYNFHFGGPWHLPYYQSNCLCLFRCYFVYPTANYTTPTLNRSARILIPLLPWIRYICSAGFSPYRYGPNPATDQAITGLELVNATAIGIYHNTTATRLNRDIPDILFCSRNI